MILQLSAASAGTLRLESLNAPYQIEVYAATDAVVPADLGGWQLAGANQFAEQPGEVSVGVDVAATYLLVWLKELGTDEACTQNNPFRGRLGEISYGP